MNRQQKRQMARNARKEITRQPEQPTTRPTRPSGQGGVEVDHDDTHVFLTLHSWSTIITTQWSKQDAKHVAEMLEKAAEGEDDVMEVVSDSGLVVTNKLPGS